MPNMKKRSLALRLGAVWCRALLLLTAASGAAQERPVLTISPLPSAVLNAGTQTAASTEGVPGISWAELLRRAKSDPPRVLAARAELDRAGAERTYSQVQWLPTFSGEVSVGYQYDNRLVLPNTPRIDSEAVESRATLGLDWAAFDLARGSRIDASSAAVRAQGFALQSVQAKAVVAAAELYLRARAASALIDDAQLSLERRSQQYQAITDLVSAGTRSPVDAQRAKIEVVSAQYALTLRRIEERAVFAALAAAVGLPATALLRPMGDAEAAGRFTITADTAARARALAYEHRAEIRGIRERLSASRFEQAAATEARLPTVGAAANGNASYIDVRRGIGVAGPQYGAGAGLYVRWRGLDPSVWAKAGVAASEATRVERERDAIVQAVGTEAVAAFYGLERARADHQRAVAVLEAAQAAREAQNGRYLAGLASLLELLDAEDLEQEARQRRIEAQRDEAIKSAQLLSACGMLAR